GKSRRWEYWWAWEQETKKERTMTNMRKRTNLRKLTLAAWIAVLGLGLVFSPSGQQPFAGTMKAVAAEPVSGTEASGDGAASLPSSQADKPAGETAETEGANAGTPEAPNDGTPETATADMPNATDSGTPNAAVPGDEPVGDETRNGDSGESEAVRGSTNSGEETLLIRRDSNVLWHNGQEYAMPKPAKAVNGATYAPARALAERLRLEIVYDARNK